MKIRDEILRLLQLDPSYSSTALARQLRLSDATISYHIKKLKKEGAIKVINSGGRNIFENAPSKTSKTPLENAPTIPSSTIGYKPSLAPSKENSHVIRVHAYALSWRIEHAQSLDKLKAELAHASIQYSMKGLGYLFFRIGSISARLTQESLTLWAPEHDVEQEPAALSQAYSEIEQQLRRAFSYVNNILALHISAAPEQLQGHTAFVADEGAEQAQQLKHKLEVRDPIDKQLRFMVDSSTGTPEAEFVHKVHFKPDSERYASMVDDVTRLNEWNTLKEIVKENTHLMNYYANNMALHVKVLRKLDRKLSQRTLSD